MDANEIEQATYEQLMQRNVELVDELKALSARKDIPWYQLSVDLTMKADERRMVMARMTEISKKGMKR